MEGSEGPEVEIIIAVATTLITMITEEKKGKKGVTYGFERG